MQSSKLKIEIITERRKLPVWYNSVEVDVCTRCSSLVFDPVAHDRFHQTWDRV